MVGKGGTAGFLGRGFDPYFLYPPGGDMDMNKMEKINVDDLKLRDDIFSARLDRRARLVERRRPKFSVCRELDPSSFTFSTVPVACPRRTAVR